MACNYRFLHIEDNPLDAEIVEEELRKEWPDCIYELICTEQELCAALAGEAFNAILSDYSLPGFDGMEALSIVLRKSPETPFIFITGAMGEEMAIDTLRNGATDYILKTRISRLIPTVERALRDSAADSELKRNYERLVKMEEQISRAGKEWQNTFDSISDSIALIDCEQRIVRCNLATTRVMGLDYEDILNQPCWRVFHGVDAPLSDCPMAKAVLSLQKETTTIQCKDRWLEVTVEPMFSDAGKMTGAVHIVRDVTEQRTMERVLQNQTYVLSGVIQSTDSAVFSVDSSFCYTSFNTTHSRTMKSLYDADIQLGSKIFDYMTSEDAAIAEANLQRAITGEAFSVVIRSGDEMRMRPIFEISHNPIKNIKGGVEGVAVFASDISERTKAEEAMREMQSQLMQQDKLATIGQLAAGVAHEINNPMGFVGSNMTTLAKYIEKYNSYIAAVEQELCSSSSGVLPEQIQKIRNKLKLDYIIRDISGLVDENNEGIDRVRRIVQDLRTFSRADSSAVDSADLNSCIDSTINIVINEIKYAAELKREYGDLPMVPCNSQQINQVFMNLLMNASHAIQAKGEEIGEIVIRTWSDQDNAFISVSDTGCGIEPDNWRKIFDAFYTTKEIGKGTGLGLSISSGIIRKHGGEIRLSSEVGVGSTFTVRLPLNPAQRVDEDPQ